MASFEPRNGEPVLLAGRRCIIREILGLTRCVLQPEEPNSRPIAADICDLRPVPEAIPAPGTAEAELPSDIPGEELTVAKRRLEIIRPILKGISRNEVKKLARFHGVGAATLYRWAGKFRESGLVISLVPQFRNRGRPRGSRLAQRQREIIEEAIAEVWLQPNHPDKMAVVKEVLAKCRKEKLKAPSRSTIYNRINAIVGRAATRARHGEGAAKRHNVLLGTLPGADFPWAIVHIDHTEMGVIIVDSVERQSINRAHITIAEDAATRMVVGFYVSLEPPSQFSTGLCLVHAMLPKEPWMAKRGIPGSWPVWGKPKLIHTDNGDGFRGASLQRACDEQGIEQHFRRIGHPEDGGRVERLIGTLERELHRLPGSTFSNPQKRGEYDSDGCAAMTLDELEFLIGNFIVNDYHQRPHRGLKGQTPIKAWEDGMLGTNRLPGLGLPPRQVDPDEVRLSFLPGKDCTVQKHGLTLNHVTYQHDSLKRWIGIKQAGNPNKGMKFWVQRDPRDISRVWFKDPELKQRIEVPYADMTRPVISLWELEHALKDLQSKGCRHVNEELIFTAYEENKRRVAGSVAATKSARRMRELNKRRNAGAAALKGASAPPSAPAALPNPPEDEDQPVTPYEDVDF